MHHRLQSVQKGEDFDDDDDDDDDGFSLLTDCVLLIGFRPEVLALKHESRILRHCCILSLSVRFVGVNSPPVKCSTAGWKVRTKK